MAKFIIQPDGAPITVEAERAEQDSKSTRVTFFDSKDNPVASFVNVLGWHKADAAEK